jgi:hypothetical protein
VLEVLPYALSALIAVIIVPGFLSAHFHTTQAVRAMDGVSSNVGALELVRGDHAAFGEPVVSGLSNSTVQRQVAAKQAIAK